MIDRFPNSDWREEFPELSEDAEKFIEQLNERISELQQELDKYKLVTTVEPSDCARHLLVKEFEKTEIGLFKWKSKHVFIFKEGKYKVFVMECGK
ncbi:MAG: hypothetical protein M1365_12570 [Actinobacteria bacterium]|nr:hypothetical protein [Actinomycetota bacterium]